MKPILTTSNARIFSTALADEQISHDTCRTLALAKPAGRPVRGSSYSLGLRFHAALHGLFSTSASGSAQREFAPWLATLQFALLGYGVRSARAEVPFVNAGLPASRCDLLLFGARQNLIGIADVKVTARDLPDQPSEMHILQVAGYCEHYARQNPGQNCAAFVVYFSITQRKLRVFHYRDSAWLRIAAKPLLAA